MMMENTDFKNYFKFPLKMWTDFDVKVFTNDNQRVTTFKMYLDI